MANQFSTPAVWFPAIRAGTGTDVFTERLATALGRAGVRAEITWLPHRAEYAPWSVAIPPVPSWANIIHINSWLHGRFIEQSGRPIVTTCHGCVHDPTLSPYKSGFQSLYHRHWVKRLESRAYHLSSVVTSVSRYTAARMLDVFGPMPVEVIPNWLPDDAFVGSGRSLPNDPFRLLYVGTWSRRKGVDLLPEIMGRLGDEFELYFTGDVRRVTSLPSNMKPLGWVSNSAVVRQWMSEADALLFPSRMEGMPLAVLEAMACGLPVICSNSASLPEVVDHGRNGLVCPRDDVEAFVKNVRRLRNDVDEWRAMRVAASARAIEDHAESGAVDAYLRIYIDVLKTKGLLQVREK